MLKQQDVECDSVTAGDRWTEEYIRVDLRKAIIEDFGGELDLPWTICALTCLPHTLGFIGLSWSARPVFDKLGFESVDQYLMINMLQYCSLFAIVLPMAHPILLRVMNWLAAGPAVLSGIAAFGLGVLTYSFLLCFDTLAAGAVEAFALTMHPAFLFAYLLLGAHLKFWRAAVTLRISF